MEKREIESDRVREREREREGFKCVKSCNGATGSAIKGLRSVLDSGQRRPNGFSLISSLFFIFYFLASDGA